MKQRAALNENKRANMLRKQKRAVREIRAARFIFSGFLCLRHSSVLLQSLIEYIQNLPVRAAKFICCPFFDCFHCVSINTKYKAFIFCFFCHSNAIYY